MKRFLFFLLIAALLLTGVALAETADFEMEYGLVTDYTGPGGDVVLPAEIDGWPITGLRWGVFNNDDTITSITLPEGLQAIGPNNIFSCRSLTQVNIPATVAFIDYDCFSWNDNLTSITFEGPVPIFGGTGFSVVNPDLVVYVPDDQLEAYRAVIPAEVNVAPSGRNAVIVDQTADEGWFEFDPDTGTITAYYGVHGYLVIPSEIEGVPVKAIANDVFYNDQRLFYAVLPEGLEVIGDNAFRYCNNMYGASLPNSLRVIGEKAFVSSWREPITSWPASLEEIGAGAFGWSGLTGELDFRGCTFAIGEAAFEYTRVQEVYMDDSGVKIAANAFQKSSLNYLCIDAYTMLDGISPDAFAGAERLADLDLPWDCTLENQLAWRAFMAPQAPDCYVWINNPTDCSYPDYDDSTYGESRRHAVPGGLYGRRGKPAAVPYHGRDPDHRPGGRRVPRQPDPEKVPRDALGSVYHHRG